METVCHKLNNLLQGHTGKMLTKKNIKELYLEQHPGEENTIHNFWKVPSNVTTLRNFLLHDGFKFEDKMKKGNHNIYFVFNKNEDSEHIMNQFNHNHSILNGDYDMESETMSHDIELSKSPVFNPRNNPKFSMLGIKIEPTSSIEEVKTPMTPPDHFQVNDHVPSEGEDNDDDATVHSVSKTPEIALQKKLYRMLIQEPALRNRLLQQKHLKDFAKDHPDKYKQLDPKTSIYNYSHTNYIKNLNKKYLSKVGLMLYECSDDDGIHKFLYITDNEHLPTDIQERVHKFLNRSREKRKRPTKKENNNNNNNNNKTNGSSTNKSKKQKNHHPSDSDSESKSSNTSSSDPSIKPDQYTDCKQCMKLFHYIVTKHGLDIIEVVDIVQFNHTELKH